MYRFGRHINITYGLASAAQSGLSTGSTAIQIFTGNPQSIKGRKRTIKELHELRDNLKELNMVAVIHTPYIINLCHPSGTKKYQDSLEALVRNLDESFEIGALGAVVHMGKNTKETGLTDYEAMDSYATSIKEALKLSKGTIILETGAGQGSEVGTSLSDLSQIYHRLTTTEKKRVGFCIDTAHIWAAGYNIKDEENVETYFRLFNELIGIDKIIVIHFNDSAVELGSCVDRHINIGYGYIPLEGLKAVAIWGRKNNVPLILETPSDKARNYKTKKTISYVDDLSLLRKWFKNFDNK